MTGEKTAISYSWDDEAHKAWVKSLATRLRGDGINVVLDQWHADLGDRLPTFMEGLVRDSRYVLVIGTPGYKDRFLDPLNVVTASDLRDAANAAFPGIYKM